MSSKKIFVKTIEKVIRLCTVLIYIFFSGSFEKKTKTITVHRK